MGVKIGSAYAEVALDNALIVDSVNKELCCWAFCKCSQKLFSALRYVNVLSEIIFL